MLYPKLRSAPKPAPPPMHYFDSAEMLLRLQAQGHSRADMSRLTGLTIPQLTERMRLIDLDEGLRAHLRREVRAAYGLCAADCALAALRHAAHVPDGACNGL